jgi:hypothetical protein
MMRDNWVHFIPTLEVKPEANLQRTYRDPSLEPLWRGGSSVYLLPKGVKTG